MKITTKTWGIGMVLVLLLATAGCGQKNLEPLSGTVTFNGEPLKVGAIVFVAAGTDGGKSVDAAAPPATAGIKDGHFEVPQEWGLKHGPYQVTIKGYEGVPRENMPLGFNLFPDFDTTFEYKGQKTAEFEVPAPEQPVELPPADAVIDDPSSPRP